MRGVITGYVTTSITPWSWASVSRKKYIESNPQSPEQTNKTKRETRFVCKQNTSFWFDIPHNTIISITFGAINMRFHIDCDVKVMFDIIPE